MESCNYIDEWPADESLVTLQRIFDSITAMAYFSVPLQLIYFIRLSPIFPDKWEFGYFGTFAVLCGATFLTNLWMYSEKSNTAALIIVVVKVSTMLLSWLTAFIMIDVIPYLLDIRKRDVFLKNRVEALSREFSINLHEEKSRRSITKLIHEIRSTLDGQSIAKSTVIGLGQIFDLEECALWFPTQTNKSLQLSHALSPSIPIGSTIPLNHSLVNEISNSSRAVRIPHTCPLVRIVAWRSPPGVVAIRVPLLHVSCTEPGAHLEASAISYAVMVLVIPSDSIREFHENELELVEAVAEQVATALAHASAIKETTMACDHLMKQNFSLDRNVHDIKTTFHATSAFLSGVIYQMSTPIHALTTLSSLLLETTLTPQQRAMTEAVFRSSISLETHRKNENDLSRLEDGTLELKAEIFNVFEAFKQVIDMIKPTAAVKKLFLSLAIAPDLPVYAVGDLEKLMQITLNIVGDAVKFTKEGQVSVTVSIAHPNSHRDWRPFKLFLVSSEDHLYLKVQVEDFGRGIDSQEIMKVFNRFKVPQITSNQSSNSGLGLAISKRLLGLMGGRIWVESEGLGKGCTATFIVKLGSFTQHRLHDAQGRRTT